MLDINKNKKISLRDKQVVIIGAGFAGLHVALELARKKPELKVILVDKSHYSAYHPGLYEVATSARSQAEAVVLRQTVAIPILESVERYKSITFKQSIVLSVDPDRHLAKTEDGDLTYDALVIAMGSQTDFFHIPGLPENSFTLKSFEDAIKIRNHIGQAFEQYKLTGDQNYLHFIVAGGGFTGVELSGELIGYIRHLAGRDKFLSKLAKVSVVEGANQLLPGFPQQISQKIYDRLDSLGINIMLNSKIISATPTNLSLEDGTTLEAKTIIWTGGVRSCEVPCAKVLPQDPKGRIVVGSRLSLESNPEIVIIGDCSSWLNPATGRPLPQTAQMAIHQAEYAAAVIPKLLREEDVPVYRPKSNNSYIIPLAGRHALFVRNEFTLSGFWAYVLRRLVDLDYFLNVLPLRRAFAYWLKGTVIYLKND